jgi:uncharacterized RmlC-like cupin family protein
MIEDRPIMTIHTTMTHLTKQQLPNFQGISADTAGSTKLCMHLVIIPPGGKASAHYHDGYETALYMTQRSRRNSLRSESGAFKQQRRRRFLVHPAECPAPAGESEQHGGGHRLVARNDPNEQESVIVYQPDDKIKKI